MGMLKSAVLRVKELTAGQIDAMYAIMEMYYNNTSHNAFVGDLMKKQDVVILLDEQNNIRGFTTLTLFPYDEHTQLLYSGDTIVEKEYWGRHDLSQAWITNALVYADNFDGVTYWFLLSKGYKTYKYLSTFFNEYYPCVNAETPSYIQQIIDTFAKRQYGDKYRNGVWVAGNDYLKGEFDSTQEVAARDKNTAFFLEKNPNYLNGDELVCLCEVSVDNLNKLGRRLLGR
jgi:hypothetical protein